MSDAPKPDPATQLLALRPEHCVSVPAALHIRRRTGRPKQVRPAPDLDGQAYVEEVAEIAEQFVAQDALVQAAGVERTRDDNRVLDEALMQIAKEQASLAFEKQKLLGEGKDIAQICSRRIEALSKMASLVLERARLGGAYDFDPYNPKIQRVVSAFITSMKECAHEALPAEAAADFLRAFEARAAGWEDKLAT